MNIIKAIHAAVSMGGGTITRKHDSNSNFLMTVEADGSFEFSDKMGAQPLIYYSDLEFKVQSNAMSFIDIMRKKYKDNTVKILTPNGTVDFDVQVSVLIGGEEKSRRVHLCELLEYSFVIEES